MGLTFALFALGGSKGGARTRTPLGLIFSFQEAQSNSRKRVLVVVTNACAGT